jgi:hypothetical protein
MSNDEPREPELVGERATVRVLIAIIDQANSDLKSFDDVERNSAIEFLQSKLFSFICNAMGLNTRRVIRRALLEAEEHWEYVKQFSTQEHENTGNNTSEKRKRKQSAKKYRLA